MILISPTQKLVVNISCRKKGTHFVPNVSRLVHLNIEYNLLAENLPGYCTISLQMASAFAMVLVQDVKSYLALGVVIGQMSNPLETWHQSLHPMVYQERASQPHS
jgi:hypothetical protein